MQNQIDGKAYNALWTLSIRRVYGAVGRIRTRSVEAEIDREAKWMRVCIM